MSRLHIRFSHAAFLLALSSLAPAVISQSVETLKTSPPKINVNDPTVDGSSLHPYTNLWKLSVTTAAGKTMTMGAWTDELKWVEVEGKKYLQRTQIAAFSQGRATSTVNVFDSKSMAPIRSDWRSLDGGFNHREFGATGVKYRHTDKAQNGPPDLSHVIEGVQKLDVPVFDFYGGMYGLLLAAMPLREGFTGTIPSIDENSDTQSWVSFTVTGQERVAAGAGKSVQAWVVESETNLGTMKFWISKDAPYIIRLTYKGPNGNFWSYDIV